MSQFLGAIAAGIVALFGLFLIACAAAAVIFFIYLFLIVPIGAVLGM